MGIRARYRSFWAAQRYRTPICQFGEAAHPRALSPTIWPVMLDALRPVNGEPAIATLNRANFATSDRRGDFRPLITNQMEAGMRLRPNKTAYIVSGNGYSALRVADAALSPCGFEPYLDTMPPPVTNGARYGIF